MLLVSRELDYVERFVSATECRPENSRHGRYVVTDAYLRFYYRFLAPHRSAIEQGRIKQATSLLDDHLLDFIGTHTFEELCREWVGISAEMELLSFLPERIGSKLLVKAGPGRCSGINWRTRDILLGECKWGHQAVGREVIQTLIEKTAKVLPKQIKWGVHYAFFARSGFTPEAVTLAQEHRAHPITLDQIESDMQQWLKLQQER